MMKKSSLTLIVGLAVAILAITASYTFAQDGGITPTPILLLSPTVPPQEVVTSTVESTQVVTSTPVIIVPNTTPLTPNPTLPVALNQLDTPLLAQEITLTALKVQNIEMASPFGSAQFTINKPDNWLTDGTSVLNLNIQYFETVPRNLDVEGGAVSELVTIFDVLMDGILIDSFNFTSDEAGSQQTIPIALPNSLLSERPGGTHAISFSMRAEDHCRVNAEARLLIRSDLSFIHFEYREIPPRLDLSLYPSGLYLDAIGGELQTIILVIPDNPTQADLQAAAAVAAGLGSLTFNNVSLEVRTASEVSDNDRRTYPIVAVGLPDQNGFIRQLYIDSILPTELNDEGRIVYQERTVNRTDGVVQYTLNPLNESLPILVVTGFTETGLLKAAQSLAGPPPVLGIRGPVALVEEARAIIHPPVGAPPVTDLTFESLGIEQFTLRGVGNQRFDIPLRIPYNQLVTSGAYLDMKYNFSRALNQTDSSLSIWINDTVPVASIFLGDEIFSPPLPGGQYQLRADLPPEAFASGEENSLTFFLNAFSIEECSIPDDLSTWFTAGLDSTIHLPRQVIDLTLSYPLVSWFPTPFNSLPDMSNVWISLPANPTPQELTQTYRLLARLASTIQGGEGFAPRITLGDIPEGSNLSDYHFIVMGRYTTNPFLALLNENLPQPFLEGTDRLEQVLDDIGYRLPAGYEVGVLETLRSPWADDKAILVITGTGATGQTNAARVLYEQAGAREFLGGDVVFVNDTTFSPVDTRFIEERTELLTAIPLLATEAVLAQSQTAPPDFRTTVTPGPTLTPSLTRTPEATLSPTALFTQTVTPTVPTPFPTFEPLPQTSLEPVAVEAPPWVNLLVIATIAVSAIGGLYALISLIRGRRSR